jgi:hypothetical protein
MGESMRRCLFCVAILVALLTQNAMADTGYKIEVLRHRQEQNQVRFFVRFLKANGKAPATLPKAAEFQIEAAIGAVTPRKALFLKDHAKGLATVLMVDQSGSMAQFQDALREAAVTFVDRMKQEDRMALLFFGEKDKQFDFESDAGILRSRLNEWLEQKPRPNTQTRLHNFLIDAIKKAAASGTEFPVVLILSDGVDSGGAFSLADISKLARENGVGIYAIGFANKGGTNYAELENLKSLAHATDGWYEEVGRDSEAKGELRKKFLQSRRQVDELLVLTVDLCGFSRDDVAGRDKTSYLVKYQSSVSPKYAAPVGVFAQEPPRCPDCPYNEVDKCTDSQACDEEYCVDITCEVWEKAAGHKCSPIACSADSTCPDGTRCGAGSCVKGCAPCQIVNDEGECANATCTTDCACGEGCGCSGGICGPVDGARVGCDKLCEFPVDGACGPLACADDEDCKASCGAADGSCSCQETEFDDGPQKVCTVQPGQSLAACSQMCQGSYLGTCESLPCTKNEDCAETCACDTEAGECIVAPAAECETCEKVQKHGICGAPPCKSDEECGETCACNAESGKCELGWFCKRDPQTCYIIGGVSGGAVLLLILLLIIFRSRRSYVLDDDDDEEDESFNEEEDFEKGTVVESDNEYRATVIDTGVTLRVIWSGQPYLDFPMQSDIISVGADSSCALHLEIPTVSSRHATFRYKNGLVTVQDDDSTNGTQVNGSRLQKYVEIPLSSGQRVELGSAVVIEIVGPGGNEAPVFKGTVIDR